MTGLRVATWNINGLAPNKEELQMLISDHNLDAVLVSEAHCTDKSSIKIQGFMTYTTNHPDGTGHAGTAIIIRRTIEHHLLTPVRTNHTQATIVAVKDRGGYLTLASVYCPPKHQITEEMYTDLFSHFGVRFIAGGDWNAKHTYWGSRLITTRGRQLKRSVDSNHLVTITTSGPTYWPTDNNKTPDLLDFFIVGGLSRHYFKAESCLDGTSDHTPVLLTVSTTIINCEKPQTLYNKHTDWESFRDYIDDNITLSIALKTPDDVEYATKYFTNLVQVACWINTPPLTEKEVKNSNMPLNIKNKLKEKRRLRGVWHTSRHPEDKTAFNKASRELKEMIMEADETTLETRLSSLTATKATNYSLWKLTKSFKRPQTMKPPLRLNQGGWARTGQEKANAFARHLSEVFTPNATNDRESEKYVQTVVNQDFQLDVPPKPITPREVSRLINNLEDKKAPGYDLLTKEILRKLPRKALLFLTYLFNGILRTQYFPKQWKVSQILMIHKPGKPQNDIKSYRPISLLPVLSKLFEKALLYRITPILKQNNAIPDHQFGFRQRHSTIEQVHRVYEKIRESLEQKEYCSSAFIDIQQAFDKVWHQGLILKLKKALPHSYLPLLISYLSERVFQVKEGEETSELLDIRAGVPQGSVLGPILYVIYTADLPLQPNITTATFADDTAVLTSSPDPNKASATLQEGLDQINKWLKKWRIKASASKSVQVTFTLRKGNCPPVRLDDYTLPHSDNVRYLGMHLDRQLTWRQHIKAKRDETNIRFRDLYWLLNRHSKLSMENKLLIYKTVLKPVWTYGIQLWSSSCNSNISMLQRLQNVILRSVAGVPWFITNAEIHEACNINTVKDEISTNSTKYKKKLLTHPNKLASELVNRKYTRRLKRKVILDLSQEDRL